jgi:hypothetical protein
MAESTFWKSAAEKFRTLDPKRTMCANWKSNSQDPASIPWRITGANSVEDRTQFLRLATLAGKQLDRLSTNGARTWLNKLKETVPSRAEHRTVKTDNDGNEEFIDVGTIVEVCQASKNLCDELELEAQVAESLGSYTEETPSIATVDSQIVPANVPVPSTTRARIEAFLARVLAATGKSIDRTDFWRVAGYQHRSEFERFQRDDRRTTKSAKRRFEEVLSLEPSVFVERLKKVR